MKIKIVHCNETGSRQLSLWAMRLEGDPVNEMEVIDPSIGIGQACVARGFAFPARTEFDLVVSITCKTSKAKAALEKYLQRSFYKEREVNAALTMEEYLKEAPLLELVGLPPI